MNSQAVPFYGLRIPFVVLIATILTLTAARVPAQSSPTVGGPVAAPSAPPAEVIPPVPTHWFSDYAKMTSPIFAIELDRRLERFDHETSDQFIVVVLPKMQPAAPVDDYCRRVFNTWHVGRKGINNGCVLFVFVDDHKLYIAAGSGIQPPLTNAVCEQITKGITADFRRGDFEGGLTNGVEAIVKMLQTQPVNRTAP